MPLIEFGVTSIAVAIPAYNEEGLPGFLVELDQALAPLADVVSFHVVDDASTNGMRESLGTVGPALNGKLNVRVNAVNSGHGPTLLRAYASAFDSGADVILHVDGDGQFHGADVRRLLEAIVAGADAVVGVRGARVDPWFRKALSRSLRLYLRVITGTESRDPNSPFRAYRRTSLERLLPLLPDDALVPSVYLTALGHANGLQVSEVPVEHRARRGARAQGTMWGRRQRTILIPKRLLVFVLAALKESFALRSLLSDKTLALDPAVLDLTEPGVATTDRRPKAGTRRRKE